MYCGDDEPRKSVDFGSRGRLGQRHMADRCNESKAVHINQSATGTQELMGWWLGTQLAAQKQDPPIHCRSPRRQSVAFCKCPPRSCCAVPEERTSLDLPGLPAPSAP